MHMPRCLIAVFFTFLFLVVRGPGPQSSFGGDGIPDIRAGQPNEEFGDLLSGPLFSAKFGDHLVPFGKEIAIDALLELPIGNDALRMRGRGLALASTVDGQTTAEARTRFYLAYDKAYTDALTAGKRYTLQGRIRHGYQADEWSLHCYELTGKPRLVDQGRSAPDAKPSVEPLNLDELVGKDVDFVGLTWSLNDHWWFERADQRIIISQIRKRPGWEIVQHGAEVRVKGRLAKELRPSLNQISLKTCRDLVPHFVIKQAAMELVSTGRRSLLSAEVYETTPTFRDGVLDLHDDYGIVYNALPWMNPALLVYGRNADLIAEIVRRDSPATRAVLRNRMNDEKRTYTLRLLDAGMLAAMNDETGRKFLMEQAEPSHPNLHSVYWVMGNLHQFPPLPPTGPAATKAAAANKAEREEAPDGRIDMTSIVQSLFGTPKSWRPLGNVDMRWAEQPMIDAIASRERVKTIEFWHGGLAEGTRREVAVDHGSFPTLLIKMKSKKAIAPLCEVASGTAGGSGEVLLALLATDHPKVVELAKRSLRKTRRDSHDRRALQAYLLRYDRELVIDDLIESIDEAYAFRALRSLGKADVLARLDAGSQTLSEKGRESARLLKLLFADDPRAALLSELDREDGINPTLVLYWLTDYADGASAQRVAELLRTAPKKYFEADGLGALLSIRRAIDACAVEDSHESLAALISLLGAIDRFDERPEEGEGRSRLSAISIDYDCYVAAKLIELTDVSFGTDKAKWEQWLAEQGD